jgi:hypothetical protein
VTESRKDVVSQWVKAFQSEGVVYRQGFRRPPRGPGKASAVYAWQPGVWHFPDADKGVIV